MSWPGFLVAIQPRTMMSWIPAWISRVSDFSERSGCVFRRFFGTSYRWKGSKWSSLVVVRPNGTKTASGQGEWEEFWATKMMTNFTQKKVRGWFVEGQRWCFSFVVCVCVCVKHDLWQVVETVTSGKLYNKRQLKRRTTSCLRWLQKSVFFVFETLGFV